MDGKNLSSSLEATLLPIRDYSDLTLECDGREFKVHRAYICAQSPVMAAALKGNFMEAKTGMLHMSFDVPSVWRFIEFIYTGDYQVFLNPAVNLLWSDALDKTCTAERTVKFPNEESVDAARPDPGVGALGLAKGITDRLSCHGRMNCIADYYDVPTLAAISCSKTEKLLATEWDAESFCHLVQQSLGSTSDKKFLQILGAAAADHIDELNKREIFEEGGLAEGLTPYVLPEILSKFKAAEARAAQLASSLSSAEASAERESQESARSLQNVEQCVGLLREHDSCRNARCEVQFNCYFDYKGPSHNPTYILRCGRCRARHE
ncbi:hypothetical protein GGR51DRAFT_571839 [Nemania sp. FL0031]|nr:hypothetical protein GGR51DRAFT_571839 [Nemania sp. FL0031]